jgi:hypothetical protein
MSNTSDFKTNESCEVAVRQDVSFPTAGVFGGEPARPVDPGGNDVPPLTGWVASTAAGAFCGRPRQALLQPGEERSRLLGDPLLISPDGRTFSSRFFFVAANKYLFGEFVCYNRTKGERACLCAAA